MTKVKRDLKRKPVERKSLSIPGLLFIPLSGVVWFGLPTPCTIDNIALYYLPMGEDMGEIQISFSVGDKKGAIKHTYFINGKPGETKAVEAITLTPNDSMTIRADKLIAPIAPGSSVCISYIMKIK